MSKRSQSSARPNNSRTVGKMRWLSGSSIAAAAFLLATAPQPVEAQSALRAPDFSPRDIRISAPLSPLPANDIRISAPLAPLPGADVRISAPLSPLPVNDIRISAPVAPLPDMNIRISQPVTPTAINDIPSSVRTGMTAINQPHAIGARIDTNSSFQASIDNVTAVASVTRGGNSDIITTFGPQNVINWTPYDTADSDDLINILPAGTTLTFVGPAAGYTILNRILPVGTTTAGDPRGIAFSGNVASRLGSDTGAVGGNIWFYSPGGIVVGAGSSFDVGGLLLTTNNIETIGSTMSVSGPAGSTSSIIIEDGATINATANGSNYVAMVAPRVVQDGSVNVNGSAAYVAAEQAELTINNGLFDISIGVGTGDANGVVHSGTTGGGSSSPTFDNGGAITDADARAIYMVAVPKNDALTMLVGGSLGYQQAATASIVNGNVVLSAGANVATTGDQTNASFAFDKQAADSDANIHFQNARFGASVSSFATNAIIATSAATNGSVFANSFGRSYDLQLEARNQIDINVSGGGLVGASGDVILRAGSGNVGGTINFNIEGFGFADTTPVFSSLTTGGDFIVDTSATGLDDFFNVRDNGGTGIGQDATAGAININIDGGDLLVGGAAQFNASAQGGKGEIQNGSGQGGNINLNISDGTFDVTGTTFFDSQVISAQSLKIGGSGPGQLGSDSVAGNISLNLSGGAVTTGGMVFSLGAAASSGDASGGAQSNDASAGAFDLTVTGGTHVIDDILIFATADASSGSFNAAGEERSGFASSGGANFLIDGGSLTINSDLDAELSTYGITPSAATDRATITVQNGATLAVDGDLFISTRAFNGSDSVTNAGGSVSILADNGSITAGGLFLSSSAKPNNQFFFSGQDEGKDFQAGDINIVARNGGFLTAGFSFFQASGTGNDTIAGNGTGGDILINADDGSIEFTDFLAIDASGIGGVGGNDENPESLGIGRGGDVTFRVQGSSGSMTFADLDVDSDGSISVGGEGGAPRFEGDGGLGFGGDITFDLLGGTFVADDITIGSDGSGGGGGDLFTLPGTPTSLDVTPMADPEDLTLAVSPFAGGVSAGDGGDGQGGDVTFNLNGGNASVTNLTISANGFGGNGANGNINIGTAGGAGGSGIGGNAVFNAQAGSLTVTNTLTVSAEGNNQNIAPYGSYGAGGFGYGSDGGNGGDGIGGTATFNLDGSATINAGNIIISTSADGGNGGDSTNAGNGPIQAGTGGLGGNATGGNATFNNNAGTLGFGQLSVTSIGAGGNGGDVFGFSTGEADNIAGNGGTGTGGNAIININQDDLNNPVYIVDASGVGGDGGQGLDGGDGGAAFGGVAAINVNNATADPDDPTIIANATGGNGGFGMLDSANNITGISGAGGAATGGTARLEVTGAGGNIDLGFIILEANATGGNGADGIYSFGVGLDGGDGGSGGDANGGTVELVARTGGTINVTSGDFTMTSTGAGGNGGNGGNSYNSTAGDAGNGGDGTGGTARLLAQGGTISGNDLNLTTAGLGGDGGTRGYYGAYGTNGANGTGGAGTGGTGITEVQEGSPGILTFANVTIDSSGTGGGGPIAGIGAGGRIEITDSSTDPAGLISFDSLTAYAFDAALGTGTGSATTLLGGFFATGNSGAISILGDLDVDVAGNIQFDLDGDGQVTVGGNATLISGQNIFVDHSNNSTPVNSIDVSGDFAATAQADFISTAGSRINAAGSASVRTGQNATVADIAGVGLVDISAMWDANVTNAVVTGTVTTVTLGAGTFVLGPQMLIQAGHDPMGGSFPTFDPSYSATIDGDVTSAGFITVNAGGNALFQSGSNTISDNGLIVQTGDDIIIETGASLVAGNAPATSPNTANPFPDTNNLILQAGALTPLISTPFTPIASIVAAGDLDANDFAVVMSANAIDGLGGTITASSISADINDAPSNAVITAIGQSDDNGLLNGQCVEGNICLGTLDADNFVHIGQASNNDVVQGIIESGTVSANEILVTTRRDIIMGTDGIATILDASNQFLVESIEGDVDLREASVGSASILVSAVNGSLLGSASLTSASDIGITVGADISAAQIDTGGQLTSIANIGGAFEASYTVPGSINVNTLTQSGNANINIVAGGDINLGRINLPNARSITLTASSGDAFLGSNSSASSISVLGNNVGFNDLLSSGIITLNATAGDVVGAGPGNLTAGSTIDLDATGNITFGLLSGPGAATADAGGNISFVTATAESVRFNAGGDIVGGDIDASNNTLASNVAVLNAGGSIAAGTINAIDGIDIDGDGNVDVSSLIGGFADILTTGAVDIGNADTLRLEALGSSISLGTANITSNAFAASGAMVLTATTGAITITDATTASATTLDAATDINIGSLSASGTFDATAGADVALGNTSGQRVVVDAGGDITGLSATAPTSTLISNVVNLTSGGTIDVDTISATGDVNLDASGAIISDLIQGQFIDLVAAGSATIGSIIGTRLDGTTAGIDLGSATITTNGFAASGFITLDATSGAAIVGTANSTNNTAILGASVTLNNGSIGGDLTLDATAGDIDGNGTITVGGGIDLAATGLVGFGDLEAQGGTFTVDAGSDINFAAATSSNAISMTAGGSINGGDLNAVNALDLDGGNITIGNANAANINFNSGANILFDSISSPNGVTLTASSGTIGVNSTGGDITVSGAGAAINLFANNVDVGALTTNSGDILISAAQNIALGSAATATGTPTAASIGLLAGGNITATGTLGAGEDISIRALGDVALANVSTGDDFIVQADGAIALAGATSSGAGIDLFALSFDTANAGQAGSIAFASETATGSNILLTSGADISATGTLNASDDIAVTASGTPSLANVISGGNSSITGTSVTLNNGTIGGDLTLNATGGDIDGTGTITVGGGIDLDATGNVGFGDLEAQGGTFTVDAAGNISFNSATSSDDMALNAGGGINGSDIDSAGAVTVESGDAISLDSIAGAGDIAIVANNASDITVGSLSGGSNIDVSTQGAFVADEASADQSGTGQIVIAADSGITLRNVTGNDIGLTAADGLVSVTNNVDVTNLLAASGAAVSIITQQDMSVAAEATGGDIGLSSATNIDVQQAVASGDIVIAAGGSATIDDTTGGSTSTSAVASAGGDITITAADDILINSMVAAANGLQLTAGGLIDIQASAVGTNIRTVSADMEIGSAGSLGQTDLTGDIQIFSDGTTQVVLGDGTDISGSFSLKNDEFSRIHSGGDLTITAVPTSLGGFDMVVQDLTVLVSDNVSGPQSANIGLGNSLNLVSGQSITVVGLLDFTNGNADSGLGLTAGENLFIDAASGIIQMTDANGEYAGSGTLSITATNIYAMTSQALADIAGLGAADIDLRLADSDGIDLADGLIRADNILMTIGDNLLIQNTATGTDYADRRGFTAGTLSVVGASTGTANIVINGIVGGATGLDAIPAVDITADFDAGSTINGCVIIDPSSCVPLPGADGIPTFDPVQDVIDEEVTPEKYVVDPFASNTIEIKRNPDPTEDPLIDEPVTGAGNEDLWVNGAGEDEDEQEQEPEPAE